MTLEEARLYLPLEDLVELDEIFEDRLFEMTRFLLSTVPVTKVIEAKIELMRKIHHAYELYAEEEINDRFERIELAPYDTRNLFDLTKIYQLNLSLLRKRISNSDSFLELMVAAEQLLQNMRDYAACWHMEHLEVPDDIRITRPEDEVQLLIELERLSKDGELMLEDLSKLPVENKVRREAIRLSLWHKREVNERAI